MTQKQSLAYVAGLMDGEAYFGIKKTKAYRCQGRVSCGYHARIQIRMVDEQAIRFVAETLGGWYYPEKPHSAQGRPLFCYQASDASAEAILRALLPFLMVKRSQAETVLEFREWQANSRAHRTKITGYRNFPNSHGTPRQVPNLGLSDEYVAECERLYLACKELNRTGS